MVCQTQREAGVFECWSLWCQREAGVFECRSLSGVPTGVGWAVKGCVCTVDDQHVCHIEERVQLAWQWNIHYWRKDRLGGGGGG